MFEMMVNNWTQSVVIAISVFDIAHTTERLLSSVAGSQSCQELSNIYENPKDALKCRSACVIGEDK